MRVELAPAYVLHARAYRETSLLLEGFARDHGRVGLVARGARGRGSKWRGVLRPFQPLLLSWTGRGELGTLTGAETSAAAHLTTGALLAGGFYLNELLIRLLARDDPHPALFGAYDDTLGALGRGEPPEPALRIFEKRMLGDLGYALVLERDAAGRALSPDTLYHYDLESGPVAVAGVREGALAVRGRTLLALAEERLDDERALAEAKRLTRAALGHYLGARPLRSRELWRTPRR